MQFKLPKSSKPTQVPQLGWTMFIGVCGASGLIGIFDTVSYESLAERLQSGAVGIGFTLWTIARIMQMKNFPQKLRKKPRLVLTIFIFIVGLSAFTELFSSTVTTSNNQTFADRFLFLMVGIGFTLWSVLRYILGKDIKSSEV
jgi:hypothetical protein